MAITGKRSVERNVLVVANDGTFGNNRLDIWVVTVLSSPLPPPSASQSTSFATQLRYNFIERCLSVCRRRRRIVLLRSAYVRHAEGWLAHHFQLYVRWPFPASVMSAGEETRFRYVETQ